MITAKFSFGNDLINGFEISGHSGYADEGSDIICSAVSSPAYMVVNTLTEIMKLTPEIETDDGYLSLKLNQNDAGISKDILKGFFLHIEELSKEYPQFIKLERGAYNA